MWKGTKVLMKHIVVDLEMNGIDKKNPIRKLCSMETIEIGAVMLDDDLKEIDSFQTYVKPEHNAIESKIKKLTGITDEMVADAPRFNDALKSFLNWCLKSGDKIKIYAWSDSDYKQIKKEVNFKFFDIEEKYKPLIEKEWWDFQKEFDKHIGFEHQISLKMALEMAGIEFEGKEHDALDDARNTAELIQIFKDKELFDKTLKRIKDAMTPKSFGISIGDMVDLSKFVQE